MQKRVVWALCLVSLFLLAASPAWAQGEQGKEPIFIYVAQWAVPRAQWSDMAKQDETEKALMDKLLTNGMVHSYGTFNVLVHQEGQPTHGSWFSATSLGNLMKALEELYKLPDVTSPVLAASKHWDYFLITRDYNGHSGTFKNAYLNGVSWVVKEGHEEEFWRLVRKYVVPMYDKLVADGTLHWYSIDSEYFHTGNPNMVEFVYMTADAPGLDKVRAAVEKLLADNPILGTAFSTMVKSKEHRDFLGWIPEMRFK